MLGVRRSSTAIRPCVPPALLREAGVGMGTLPVRMKLPGHCVSGNVPVTVSAYKSAGYEFDRGALCAASRKVAQQAAQRLANSCAVKGAPTPDSGLSLALGPRGAGHGVLFQVLD